MVMRFGVLENIIVVFGFINIGKMYFVVECMLVYGLGMIGLFLCLFVWEIYDCVVVVKGVSLVVLIIGEEKIVLCMVCYFICMVEFMLMIC